MIVRIAIGLIVIALSGCSTGHQLKAPSGHFMRTADGQWDVVISSSTDSWPLNEYFDLDITIKRAPTTGVGSVHADASMPAHRHGMNVAVDTIETSSDTWITRDMLLHMPGDWLITVDITDEAGVLHRASMPIVVN